MLQYFGSELRVADRYAGQVITYVNGEATLSSQTPPTPTRIVIVKPHPITGKELLSLPDGGHIREWTKSWTESTVEGQESPVAPDVIGVDNDFYRVHVIYDRRPEGGALKFFMRRLSKDEPSPLDNFTG